MILCFPLKQIGLVIFIRKSIEGLCRILDLKVNWFLTNHKKYLSKMVEVEHQEEPDIF